MTDTLKPRENIDKKYLWDIDSMYPDPALWEADLAAAKTIARDVAGYAGRLSEGPAVLLEALRLRDALSQTLSRVMTYAHMKRDENNGNEKAQELCDRSLAAASAIGASTAFFVPELIGLGEETIRRYLSEEDGLSGYQFYLEQIIREQQHILSPAEEALLARLSEVTGACDDVFTMLNNADLSFGTVRDEEGNDTVLTHGNYINYLESHDRDVRRDAFEHMYHAYEGMINTIGATYAGSVKNDVAQAQIRHYAGSRDAALDGDNIPASVYDNLVKQVNGTLPALHKYIGIRKRVLGVDELGMHDVYVPLVKIPRRVIPYEEAQEIILEALKPMGEQYLADLKQGFADRWADVYETPGKTSGAYSFGSYDSKPFVLLNYTDTLQDVFTVIHEMGHSMNSLYTRRTQPYRYGEHSIFTAEVASTVNENLLMKHLLATETDETMLRYLVNMHIEAFRTTLFRQTMFAEFEDLTHRKVEEGGALTPAWLSDTYYELNKKYFGPDLSEDPLIRYEWARIPHFYRAFYVYQYATGYSAASAISDIILEKGPEDYLRFLAQGVNDWPIEILKIAGVDMSTPEPVAHAMKVFTDLVDRLDSML